MQEGDYQDFPLNFFLSELHILCRIFQLQYYSFIDRMLLFAVGIMISMHAKCFGQSNDEKNNKTTYGACEGAVIFEINANGDVDHLLFIHLWMCLDTFRHMKIVQIASRKSNKSFKAN